jgi:hypothetical protein
MRPARYGAGPPVWTLAEADMVDSTRGGGTKTHEKRRATTGAPQAGHPEMVLVGKAGAPASEEA